MLLKGIHSHNIIQNEIQSIRCIQSRWSLEIVQVLIILMQLSWLSIQSFVDQMEQPYDSDHTKESKLSELTIPNYSKYNLSQQSVGTVDLMQTRNLLSNTILYMLLNFIV